MNKTKKLTIAGMFLWDVEIEYVGDGYLSRKDRRTLKIATRHKTITEAQKKTKAHLRAFRYDYPASEDHRYYLRWICRCVTFAGEGVREGGGVEGEGG